MSDRDICELKRSGRQYDGRYNGIINPCNYILIKNVTLIHMTFQENV